MNEKSYHISKYFKNSLAVFLVLCTLSIPFTWTLFPLHDDLTKGIFLYPVKGLSELLNYPITFEDFSSDTRALLLLCLINLLLSLGLSHFILKGKHESKIYLFINSILVYYLSLILLKYGFDKLFKAQFYLPEPNLLYTQLGNLDKDILYWSTMGSSRSYNIFMGMAEIVPGIMILFRRARIVGLILTLGVLINVVAVNFSFDISVKIFSSFLLLITLYLLMPSLKFLWNTLIVQKVSQLPKPLKLENGNISKFIKPVILLLFAIEVLFPYIKTTNFNDDTFPRPQLHGAYENLDSNSDIKRIYVHRNAYLIFEDSENNFVDYKMEIEGSEVFIITDYDLNTQKIEFNYDSKSGIISLFPDSKKEMNFTSLDWKKLPLLQKKWHFTLD